MKISIITLHAVRNYGSALQTYATQHIFESLGLKTEIIDYRRTALKMDSIKDILKNKQYDIKMKIKLCLILPSTKKMNAVFEPFLQKYINLTDKVYSTDDDFLEFPVDSDIYCTGSDQVWNSGWHDGIPYPFFLSFVPDSKLLISFSASFGKATLEQWERAPIKHLLERYDYISVRENSAVSIISDLGIDNAICTLDPTLTVDPQEWKELADAKSLNSKYILVYQLNNNKMFDEYAKKLAKKKNLKLVRVCTRYDQLRKTGKGIVIPKIETFLSLLRDAEYIITDSFHATAFSLIFHKKFLCIYPKLYSTRLESILDMVELKSRHLLDYNDFDMIDENIDYTKIDEILSENRKKTIEYLKKAVQTKAI